MQFEGLLEGEATAIGRKTVLNLLLPRHHPHLLKRRRAWVIASRVQVVAGLFAVLTPLWIVVDLLAYDAALAARLAAGRVVVSIGFGLIALGAKGGWRVGDARAGLLALLGVLVAFFVYSNTLLAGVEASSRLGAAVTIGYGFLPFVVVAGLSVFPLTLVESVLGAVLMASAAVVLGGGGAGPAILSARLEGVWLLALIAGTSALAGMSQLHLMEVLVRRAAVDPVTEVYSRTFGTELLRLQFSVAERADTPLSLAFIDLDSFKSVNDRFGHQVGDRVLVAVAERLRNRARDGDAVIRWGGEEFLMLFTDCNAQGAAQALGRIGRDGFARLPDGSPQTASIGIAERTADGAGNWQALVEIADRRMYRAKQAGRNLLIDGRLPGEPPMALGNFGPSAETADDP